MSGVAAAESGALGAEHPPQLEQLCEIVRRGLGLGPALPVAVCEISEHSHFNYVYRVEADGQRLYLKATLAQLKRLPGATAPRERIFCEAEAIRRWRAHCGAAHRVPRVLFEEREAFLIALEDVGAGRALLLERLTADYEGCCAHARALGAGLAAVHGATRGCAPWRPPQLEALGWRLLLQIYAAGAQRALPEQCEELFAELGAHREALVHGDLWGVNVLVGAGLTPALVDFEAAHVGDPALDIATLLCAFLLPVFERECAGEAYRRFAAELLRAYLSGLEPQWARASCERAFRYAAFALAHRAVGAIPYPLSERARERAAQAARRLALERPPHLDAFLKTAAGL